MTCKCMNAEHVIAELRRTREELQVLREEMQVTALQHKKAFQREVSTAARTDQVPRILSDTELTAIKVNDEGVRFLMLCLASEVRDFASSRDVAQSTIEKQLPLVFGELNRCLGDLLDVRSVPAGDAPGLAGLSVHFSYPAYRLVAQAAKDRAAGAVDGD